MSPFDVMLWALAVLVVIVSAAVAVAVIAGVAQSVRKPKSKDVFVGEKVGRR